MKITKTDRNNDNTPILSNREIDEFAHEVLKDYKPSLLREPGAIDYENFLESYLGAKIIFRDLYNENPEKLMYARTIFTDRLVKVFNREKNCISNIPVRGNTVILDNYVIESGREKLAKFTGLHEAGHLLIHYGVYSVFKAGQICCRRENIEGYGKPIETPEQWIEHQANYFAAAVAMPNATFNPLVGNFLRENGLWKTIILGVDDDLDLLAKDLLPEYIAEIYDVSKQTAFIKLKSNGFISTKSGMNLKDVIYS